jgi:probable selenium-dependent hydroxylase accessory protein YqeC
VKAPREWEPVIPPDSTLVIAILGIDGMGRDLQEENVFQAAIISRITGLPLGEKITDEAFALLLTHREGVFKGAPLSSRVVAFLNKVDVPDGIARARAVSRRILEKGHRQIERIVLGQVKKVPPAVEVILAR